MRDSTKLNAQDRSRYVTALADRHKTQSSQLQSGDATLTDLKLQIDVRSHMETNHKKRVDKGLERRVIPWRSVMWRGQVLESAWYAIFDQVSALLKTELSP